MHLCYYNTQRAKNSPEMEKTCWKSDLIWDRIYAQTDLHTSSWIPPCKCIEPYWILIPCVMTILMYCLVAIISSMRIFIRHVVGALPKLNSRYPKAWGCDFSAWKLIFCKTQVCPDNPGVLVEHRVLCSSAGVTQPRTLTALRRELATINTETQMSPIGSK